jgi:hypothetical protein
MSFRTSSQRNACAVGLLVALVGLAMPGCGSAPEGVEVSGQLLMQDAPLAQGSLILIPQPGTSGPKVATRIENGQFKFTPRDLVQPGHYRVEIYADDELPFALDDPQQFAAQKSRTLPQNPIAAEFNRESRLVADLSGAGPHQLSFTVTRAK